MDGTRFMSQIGRMANKFKSHGIEVGDHVAIVGLNHMSYTAAKLGVIAAGAVPVLFNPMFTSMLVVRSLLYEYSLSP